MIDSTSTEMALPPPELRELVAGTTDVEWYQSLGLTHARNLLELLQSNGVETDSLNNILDFGCGCGRVTHNFAKLIGKTVNGTDYNQSLVAWLSNNIPDGKVYLNDLAPPTIHDSNSFDLIYAISIFTHLSEPLQIAWMAEFHRLLKQGGLLIVTTHGAQEYFLELLTEQEKQAVLKGQLVVHQPERQGSNDCFTVQTLAHVKALLGEHFELLDYREQGSPGNPAQDIYLIRKGIDG
jgi:cyclopropane fatty-acyl-phospholipid synthase-like methyltransferase